MDLQRPPKPPADLYQELSRSSIRLLRLSPISDNGVIHCSLDVFELQQVPEYRALSYVWGNSHIEEEDDDESNEAKLVFDQTIYCNEKPFLVTQNVVNALQQIRSLHPEGHFWIDCICIDQSNGPERSNQVLLMGKIYSKATEVIAWLGNGHPLLDDFVWAGTTFIIAIMQLLLAKGNDYVASKMLVETLYDPEFWEELGLPFSPQRLMNAGEFDARTRWFHRSWIVQEAILNLKVQLLCGTVSLRWDYIGALGSIFTYRPVRAFFAQKDAPRIVRTSNVLGYQVMSLFTGHAHHISRLDGSTGIFETRLFMSSFRVSNDRQLCVGLMLLLCASGRGTNCSDKRDKIYANLGMISQYFEKYNLPIDDYVRVDYESQSVVDVYRRIAETVLEHLDCLFLLSFVEDKSRRRTAGLPSWVPDFDTSQNFAGIQFQASDEEHPFQVWGEGASYVVRVQVTGNMLKLRGVRVDHVELVISASKTETTDSLLRLCLPDVLNRGSQSRIEMLWRTTLMLEQGRKAEKDAGNPYSNAFHAAMAYDFARNIFEARDQTAEQRKKVSEIMSNWIDKFEPEIASGELPSMTKILEVGEWLFAAYEDRHPEHATAKQKIAELNTLRKPYLDRVGGAGTGHGRSPLRTKRGSLGLGLPSTVADDQIWMLHGGDVPFVLRPVEGKQGYFTLVGECYLHGYMYGELLSEDPSIAERLETLYMY